MDDMFNGEQRDAVESCARSGHNWRHKTGRCGCCGWPATSVADNLRKLVIKLELAASMGCENPPDNCGCPGCTIAAEVNAVTETLEEIRTSASVASAQEDQP